MPPRKPNPWRDLAETIAQQVTDAVQQNRRPGHGGWQHGQGRGKSSPSPYLSWDDQRGKQADPADDGSPGRDWTEPARSSRPRISSSDLSSELRGLLAETVGATTRSIQERREERRRTEPLRRAKGVRVRQRVAAGVFGATTVVFGAATAGVAADGNAASAAIGGVVTLGAGAGTFTSSRRARNSTKQVNALEQRLGTPTSISLASPLPPPRQMKPLPPESSAAYEPMRRLYAQERVLQQMIPEIAPVAPDIAEIADASEQSLEQLSGRIVLLENAVRAAGGPDVDTEAPGGVTADEYGGLRTSLQRIVDRLSDGVAAHERLIGAAASVIAEMSTPTPGPTPISGLREAADGLQALATGLREVSRPATTHLPPSDTTQLSPPVSPPSATDDVPDYGTPRDRTRKPSRRTRDQGT